MYVYVYVLYMYNVHVHVYEDGAVHTSVANADKLVVQLKMEVISTRVHIQTATFTYIQCIYKCTCVLTDCSDLRSHFYVPMQLC